MLLAALALALSIVDAFACCSSVTDKGSCRLLADVTDSRACDPASEWALCQVDGPRVLSCEPVSLYCCAATSGVGWMDACEEYMPGTRCGGAIVGEL